MLTVLVVDGDAIGGRSVARTLFELGYKVLYADGVEAAVLISERYAAPIDVLLTDVMTNGVNGPWLARRLKRLHPDLRIVYTSALASAYLVESLAPHGREAFLRKPASVEQLSALMRHLAAREYSDAEPRQ